MRIKIMSSLKLLSQIILILLGFFVGAVLCDVHDLIEYEYQNSSAQNKSPFSSNDYHPTDHPIYSLPHFSHLRDSIQPVVMKKYYLYHRVHGPRTAEHSIFSPGAATYLHQDSGDVFVKNADVFVPGPYPWTTNTNEWDMSEFGEIHLNYPVRVFALLHMWKYTDRDPPQNYYPWMSGLPDGWKLIGAVRTEDRNQVKLGGVLNWGNDPRKLLPRALAAEAVVKPETVDGITDYVVHFPHPHYMRTNGDLVRSISFIFVPPQRVEGLVHLDSFSYPDPLPPFPAIAVDGEELSRSYGKAYDSTTGLVHTERDPARPNQKCPEWLHSLYVTTTHRTWSNSSLHEGEPEFWRTWHPAIDPVYWCNFDHEHGSFPGRTYKPAFGYMAWKTPDNRTEHGRQEESHRGFKIFYLPLDSDRSTDRAAVFTVHMHVSKARRFSTRHHTMMLAVLRGHPSRPQDVEMELSFKADFGPAVGQLHGGGVKSLTEADRLIREELYHRHRKASRVFNVINIDGDFPDSLDRTYRIRGDVRRGPDAVLNGNYEQWRTTLPSCTTPVGRGLGEFLVDIRDPTTAVRFPGATTDGNIQWMRGKGLRRILRNDHQPITLAKELCFEQARQMIESNNGVFYTDPYFTKAYSHAGPNRARQFIKQRFGKLVFPRGFIRANDPWSGVYKYGGSPGLQWIEKGISRHLN